MKTFPEINALNLKDTRSALRMAYNTVDSLTEAGKRDLRERITHLEDRKHRLESYQAPGYCEHCGPNAGGCSICGRIGEPTR